MRKSSTKPLFTLNVISLVGKTPFKITLKTICILSAILFIFISNNNAFSTGRGYDDNHQDESVFTIENVHEFGVNFMEFSSDSNCLYTCGSREIRRWDTKTGAKLAESEHEEYRIDGFDISPDGKYIVTGGEEIELRSAKDLKTTKSSDFYAGKKGVDSKVVAFTKDGNYIIATDDEGIRLFSAKDLKPVRTIVELKNKSFKDICLNSDGSLIALCDYDKEIILIDGKTWKPLKIISDLQDYASCLAFSPDDKLLAAGLYSGEIIIFQVDPLTVKLCFFGHQDGTYSIAFSPNGKLLASGGSQFTDTMLTIGPPVNIWSVETGELVKQFKGHSTFVSAVAFNPDKKQLASCGGSQDAFSGDCVKYWNIKDFMK